MKHWYVKELSKLTHISVRTLYHYDEIGLLKPSLRRPNGYRLYTEMDLVKLQQILALKFFGFDLKQIRILLNQNADLITYFHAQSELLRMKAKKLLEAEKTLQEAIKDCRKNQDISWEKILNLIEVFQMTEQYKNSWAEQVLSAEELKQYARFEQSLQKRFTLEQKEQSEKAWANLITEIKNNLKNDPSSEIGIALGKQCMQWVNELYGREFAALRHSIWEKGFKGGHIGADFGMTPEIVNWLDQAISAYFRQRVIAILSKVGHEPSQKLETEWHNLMLEMCGGSQEAKDEAINKILQVEKLGQEAKTWLRSLR